jgi:hypothetical protein
MPLMTWYTKLRNSAWHIQRVCTALYQKKKRVCTAAFRRSRSCMCHVAAGEVAGNNRAHQAIHCSLIQSHVARPSRGSHHRLLMLLLPLLLLSEKRTTRGGGGEAKLRPASWSHKKKTTCRRKKIS